MSGGREINVTRLPEKQGMAARDPIRLDNR
jgi:hypothetical protein